NRSVWRNRGVLRISTAGWACLGKWCSFQDGGNIHFPTQNFFLNSLKSALFLEDSCCKSLLYAENDADLQELPQ
ncbi:hypothetical protein, partial [uncultured Paenibacillus sp.]|uniref:hypothetical protein n=1 Tax=uncultured Paenibacillus sp. TaxID=227322 RepID=UPI0025D8CA6A